MYEYNILISTNMGVPYLHFIVTDVNLLEMYKAALASNADTIMWEKGVLPVSSIAGIIELNRRSDKDVK